MGDEVDRPYAGQEGEINDKLVLDLAWERQQKKVLPTLQTSWTYDVPFRAVKTVVLAGNSQGNARARGSRAR